MTIAKITSLIEYLCTHTSVVRPCKVTDDAPKQTWHIRHVSCFFANNAAFVSHSETDLQSLMVPFQSPFVATCEHFSVRFTSEKAVAPIDVHGYMPRAGIIINGTKLAKVEVFYLGSFMCNNCSLEKGICRLSECSLPKNSLWQWF